MHVSTDSVQEMCEVGFSLNNLIKNKDIYYFKDITIIKN